VQAARNIAIIALLALAVAALPGGDAAAETVVTAISMAFLAAIAWAVARLYMSQSMTLATLTDGRRGLLYGAVGAIVLLFVGIEEFGSWEGGILLWIALMAAAVGAIIFVVRDATTYT